MIEQWKEIVEKYDEKFKNILKLPKLKNNSKILLLCDGDVDGIISGAMMWSIFAPLSQKIEVVFLRAHYVKKPNSNAESFHSVGIITEPYDLVIAVDVAVNNRNPDEVIEFINSIKNKLVWIDHHEPPRTLPNCCVVRPEFKSCVKLIRHLFPQAKFSKKLRKLMRIAHKTDQGHGDNLFDNALKINLKNDESRYEIFRYAIAISGGHSEKIDYMKIVEKAEKHVELEKNTKEAVEKWTKFYGKVAVVDMRDHRDKRINSTDLFFSLYKKGAKAVIYRYYSSNQKKDEYLKISRAPTVQLDLLKLFKIRGGAKYRVTVKKTKKIKELIKILQDAVAS